MNYDYLIHIGILTAIYMINAFSFNLSLGYTGLINLGQMALFGFGAYASALLTRLLGMNVWVAMFIAGLMTMVLGMVLALPALRLKKDYLALVMLGLSFILYALSKNWISLTRGSLGLPGTVKLFKSNLNFLIAAILIAIITYVVLKKIVNSKLGLVFQAIRDDELSAAVLGKDIFISKAIALGISAFFAGVAGSLLAHYLTFIDPSIFDLSQLVILLSMLIVGGLASLEGTALGVLAIVLITEPLRFIGFSPVLLGPMREIIYAALLLIILIYRPRGLLGKVDID